MSLEITPLAEALGAEVRGWDPADEVSDETLARIKRALRQHLALVFRGHRQPTDAELVRFASHFGEFATGTTWFGDDVEYPQILPITNVLDDAGNPKGTGGAIEFPWHADYSYLDRVGKDTFLDAVELPRVQSCTDFADMYTALETLPRTTVEKIRGMTAHHDLLGFVAPEDMDEIETHTRLKQKRDERAGVTRPAVPEADHPMTMRHPEAGREALYVSPGMTRRVLNVSADESDALLQSLFEHATRPEFIYRHRWQLGDLVVFDTIGLMHRRDRFDPADRRHMRQMSSLV